MSKEIKEPLPNEKQTSGQCEFSIIVPAYNVEKYLADCLESVLSQTFTDFEILLINDGSTDKT